MEKIVNLCKDRGFVFAGSEIYGGLANTWDYGPLGVLLKNNIKNFWMQKFVQECDYNVALDSAILMNTKVWEASGHISNFSDPLLDCKLCKSRFRADKLIEDFCSKNHDSSVTPEAMSFDEMSNFIVRNGISCPKCGKSDFTPIRKFNLMFKMFQGVTEDNKNEIYLRPETAQGIFVNFANVCRAMRRKLPFGIAQIGKSFRNEITPGNFVFRTREFEQMEFEFFCKPGTDLEWFDFWKKFCMDWLLEVGMKSENLRFRDHEKEELSHYSAATSDIEYKFPFGWGELWGIADRTDYDLKSHQKVSGRNLEYFDSDSNEKYFPCVVEPSLGVDRLALAIICDAYNEEQLDNGDVRTVLKFSTKVAPHKACVLPLSKKLNSEAHKILSSLRKKFSVTYDDVGSIGKRYRRQDEIGTPFCVTFDFDSAYDGKVTVRSRDTMKQVRIPIDELETYLCERIY